MPMPKKDAQRNAEPKLQAVPRIREAGDMQKLSGIRLQQPDPTGLHDMRGQGFQVTVCDQCDGSGWIVCPRGAVQCECRRALVEAQMMERAGIPERYTDASFDTYTPNNAHQSAALVKARGFAENWPMSRGRGLVLYGPVGTGKTHLAMSIVRECVSRGSRPVFVDMRTLLENTKASYGKDGTKSYLLQRAMSADLAVLDELGAARQTDWSADVVEHIINTRYNENLATVVTSNLAFHPPAEANRRGFGEAADAMRQRTLVDAIGARMLSRLKEMTDQVEVLGDDFRARARR